MARRHWWDDHAFFVGEVEPCINSRVVALGAYFGEDVTAPVERLLGEQMADGGWNCEQERGSTRGSFNTTINVLEGLLAHERATGGSAESAAARGRAHEYLLERRLLRRLSTGEMVDPDFARFAFPTDYNYDVLRALDYFCDAGVLDERSTRRSTSSRARARPMAVVAPRSAQPDPHRFRHGRDGGRAQPLDHASGASGPRSGGRGHVATEQLGECGHRERTTSGPGSAAPWRRLLAGC